MDLNEIGCDTLNWIRLIQNRNRWLALMDTIMKLLLYNINRILRLAETISFS
jgi:hypothetical protein